MSDLKKSCYLEKQPETQAIELKEPIPEDILAELKDREKKGQKIKDNIASLQTLISNKEYKDTFKPTNYYYKAPIPSGSLVNIELKSKKILRNYPVYIEIKGNSESIIIIDKYKSITNKKISPVLSAEYPIFPAILVYGKAVVFNLAIYFEKKVPIDFEVHCIYKVIDGENNIIKKIKI